MVWFKVDDQLHDHRKTRAAGKAAMGVWVLAGSWCGDRLSDGFVPTSVLTRWGTHGDAQRLVEAGLWEPCQQDGEDGWRFHNWAEFQPSKLGVQADRAATRGRVKAWRAQTCTPSATPSRPAPPQSKTHELTDDDLDAIARQTHGSRTHAAKVAGDITNRATEPVLKPLAYVLRAVGADPGRYRSNEPLLRAEECPTHPGKPGAACPGCAADAKAADR